MLVKEIMSTDVQTVSTEDTLLDTVKKMQKRNCGSIIVTKDDRLVGMITDRDIAIRAILHSTELQKLKAHEIMTPEIFYCHELDDVDVVNKDMAKNKVRRMPVLNAEKRLVGMISLGDMASHSNFQLCGETLGTICRAA